MQPWLRLLHLLKRQFPLPPAGKLLGRNRSLPNHDDHDSADHDHRGTDNDCADHFSADHHRRAGDHDVCPSYDHDDDVRTDLYLDHDCATQRRVRGCTTVPR